MCITKMASTEKQRNSFDDLWNNQAKTAENMPRNPERSSLEEKADVDINRSSLQGSVKKRKTLEELHLNPPLGFRKFESEVDWQTIDKGIALQLWEDVYKPLYTF